MVSVDARSNLLTVETREGDRVSYNPALLKQQANRSTVYKEESRELAEGERIQFTIANPELRIRAGSLATVEKIGEDNAVTVRLDNGRPWNWTPSNLATLTMPMPSKPRSKLR